MRRLKAAVIGVGVQGELHVKIYKMLKDVDLVAVVDINEERAKFIASTYKVPKYYTNYVDMFEKEKDLDLVSVVTPDHLHKDPCVKAAQYGKHILVEKPLATKVEDAKEIVEAAKKHGVKLMVNYANRWNPPFALTKELIKKGELGELLYGHIKLNDTIYVPTKMIKWAAQSSVLYFLGSHLVDMMVWLFEDRVESVRGYCRSEVLKKMGINTPDYYISVLKFRKGGLAILESCWVLPEGKPSVYEFEMNLVGAKSSVHVWTNYQGIIRFSSSKAEFLQHLAFMNLHGSPYGFIKEAIAHFIDCIIQDKEPLVSGEQGLYVTKVLNAIERSAKEGREIKVE